MATELDCWGTGYSGSRECLLHAVRFRIEIPATLCPMGLVVVVLSMGLPKAGLFVRPCPLRHNESFRFWASAVCHGR